MATSLVQIDSKKRQRLARRAKRTGKSLTQEMNEAVDLYLSVPPEMQKKLSVAAKQANRAADRMIKRLDRTIAHVDRVLRQLHRAE
jgi:hypothetical protein